jgi:hypothetical protein
MPNDYEPLWVASQGAALQIDLADGGDYDMGDGVDSAGGHANGTGVGAGNGADSAPVPVYDDGVVLGVGVGVDLAGYNGHAFGFDRDPAAGVGDGSDIDNDLFSAQ